MSRKGYHVRAHRRRNREHTKTFKAGGKRKALSHWELVDETPYEDQADEIVQELREDGTPESDIKVKMSYGQIHDPGRPLFRIYVKSQKIGNEFNESDLRYLQLNQIDAGIPLNNIIGYWKERYTTAAILNAYNNLSG